MTVSVAALIVTYQRPDVLAITLQAVAAQSSPPTWIVVVDNDAERVADVERLVTSFGAQYVWAGSNLGYGAAIALGMDRAQAESAPDAYWVLDDDSTPDRDSLANLLGQLRPGAGVIANRGGAIRFGRIRHSLASLPSGAVETADFTLLDGALVTAAAVQRAGTPRRDLFMMMEDFEYTSRVREAGFDLLVVGGDTSDHRHLGSTASWRGYYQSRNLLRIAFDRRSPSLLFGWAVREVTIGANLVLRRQFRRVALRWRGAFDGARGRMGHTRGLP